MVNWVNDSDDILFREEIENYFNLEYLLRYYLVVMMFGAVDNLGKNAKLTTWDGRIWYYQFYDLDTTMGLDNSGFLKYDSSIEVEPGVFNTSNSQLWTKVARVFDAEIKEQYALMRQDRFTLDNIMKYLYGEQISQIPKSFYNSDMQTKYLNFGSSFLYACHGDGLTHIKRWVRERMIYMDTLMQYNVTTADYITIRANHKGLVYLDLQTYVPMYLKVKWRDEANDTGIQIKRVGRGETVHFEYIMPTETDQEVIIYGGQYLKDLGDLSNLNPTTMLISNAKNLTNITVHASNLVNTDLSKCTLLENIDISECTSLGTGIGAQPTLDLSNLKYLNTINAKNTRLTAIYTNQTGGSIKEIYYPPTIQQIILKNQPFLKNIRLPQKNNLAELRLTNCTALESFSESLFSDDDQDVFTEIRNLELNNSYIKNDTFIIKKPEKLENLSLYNMPNLEVIKIGAAWSDAEQKAPTIESLNFENCPNVHTFYFSILDNETTILNLKTDTVDLTNLTGLTHFYDGIGVGNMVNLFVPKTLYYISVYNKHSSIENLWCKETCNHPDNFTGIDLNGLTLIDTSFHYITKPKIIINGYFKQINKINKFNNIRQGIPGMGLLKVEGTLDYSEFTGSLGSNAWYGTTAFCQLKDPDGKLNIIFPNDWSKSQTLGYLFYNSVLPNVSWDLINDIFKLRNPKANVMAIARSAKLGPFVKYAGLDIDDTGSECSDYYALFGGSNLNHIVRCILPNAKKIDNMFEKLNLPDVSMDFVNDFFYSIKNTITYCMAIFKNTKFGKPFSKYEGLDLNYSNTSFSATTNEMFMNCNINKIKQFQIKSGYLYSIFNGCNFEQSWDIVNKIFKECDATTNWQSTFQNTKFSEPFTEGLEIESDIIVSLSTCFSGSNINKIKRIVCPNLTNMNETFRGLSPNILEQSADIANEILANCPNIKDITRWFFSSGFRENYSEGLDWSSEKLLYMEYSGTNIVGSPTMKIKRLYTPNVMRVSGLLQDKTWANSWDVAQDWLNEIKDSVRFITSVFMNCKMQPFEKYSGMDVDLPYAIQDTSYLFYQSNVPKINSFKIAYMDFEHVDTKKSNEMLYNLSKCTEINNVLLAGYNTSNLAKSSNYVASMNNIDLSRYTNLNFMFGNMHGLVKVTELKMNPNTTTCTNLFYHCQNVKVIETLDFSGLKIAKDAQDCFNGCTALETIRFTGTINVPFSITSKNLTMQSLENIIEHLYDRTGLEPLKLTIGDTNIKKLSDDLLSIVANKNWILA